MSGVLSITGFGFDELTARLNSMGPEIQQKAGDLVYQGAQEMESIAKSLAPVDNGLLRASIIAEKDGEFGAKLEALADYSAYIEFGTGTRVSIATDADRRAYEEQFKTGKNITGMYARPFFFPAVDIVAPKVIQKIEIMLQEEASK